MWKTASILVGAVLVLVALGVVMLASTSSVQGETVYNDPHFFVKRQLLWLLVSSLLTLIAMRMDYRAWKYLAPWLLAATVVLLVLLLIPGIGHSIKGSRRWFRFGPMSFQPSELAKITTLILMAWWMARVQRRSDEFIKGLLIPLGCLGVVLLLIFVEPDFGTTMLVALVGMTVMFLGGTRVGYLVVSGLLGLVMFTSAVMQSPERLRRIIAFLNPEKYARDEAFQLLNAIYAFVVGGGTGVGLGQSLQKRFYLPEAHTDFIFAIIGEELGLAASLGVVILFVVIFICGLLISVKAPDTFGRLLGFGATLMITMQAAINIGVVTGSLPTKGLALPFISFGGSSLAASGVMIGILVNIAVYARDDR